VSLINEALKRAQAEKSGTPLPEAVPIAPPPQRPPGPSRAAGRLLAGLVAVLLLGGGILTWRLLGVARPPAAPAVASAGAITPGEPPQARSEAEETVRRNIRVMRVYTPPEPGDAPAPPPAIPADSTAAEGKTSAPPPSPATQPASQATPREAPPKATNQPASAPAKAAAPAFDPARYKLGGVVLGDYGGSAILNDRVVQVGDSLDGAKVVKITARAVHLEFGGQVFIVGN